MLLLDRSVFYLIKKKENPSGVDIPSVTENSPSKVKKSRDSDFESSSDWEYETGIPSGIGSANVSAEVSEFPTAKKVLNANNKT